MWNTIVCCCICLLVCGCSCNAAAVMEISGKVLGPSAETLANVPVTLNAGVAQTLTAVDGTFIFHDISTGVYLVDVLDVQYHFSQLKIKVAAETDQVNVVDYKYPGATKQPGQYPLQFKAHAPLKYFEEREKLGLHTLMNSGMLFTVLVPLAMVFLLPKMMQSVDPAEMKEMQKQMATNNPQQMLSQIFGGRPNTEEDE